MVRSYFLTSSLVFFLAIAAFASPNSECGAVLLPHEIDGISEDEWLGFSVAAAGDVNGDGTPDFIVGAPYADLDTVLQVGAAYVYSGTDGSLLFQFKGSATFDELGNSVAGAGDVNADGKPDFIFGAPTSDPGGVTNAGYAVVYSGADGSLLHRVDGALENGGVGWSVAGAGDVNGDGKADFIVGSLFNNVARVFSGLDGSLLYNLFGTAPGDGMGFAVAGLGDLNQDGKSDFIVSARWTDLGGLSNVGSVYVYSGADGSLIYQKDGPALGGNFGFSVAAAGDVNGDGTSEFIVGAPRARANEISAAGTACVYSGADGSLLYQVNGVSAGGQLGFSVAGAGDVTGDGKAEFIVGADNTDAGGLFAAGSAFVYSGADGSLLYQMDGTAMIDHLGWAVSGIGDVDGDGRGDFAVGAPAADPNNIDLGGSVYIFKSGSLPGDVSTDALLTSADVVMLLKAVYLGVNLSCPLCAADVTCDGLLTSADIVTELNAVFLGTPITCTP